MKRRDPRERAHEKDGSDDEDSPQNNKNNKNTKTLQKILQLQCEICQALANPFRLAIVEHLKNRELGAADLIAELDLSKVNLSKHMTVLSRAGVVESRREGRSIYYRLTDPEINRACAIMRSILLKRLKQGEKLASAITAVRE